MLRNIEDKKGRGEELSGRLCIEEYQVAGCIRQMKQAHFVIVLAKHAAISYLSCHSAALHSE